MTVTCHWPICDQLRRCWSVFVYHILSTRVTMVAIWLRLYGIHTYIVGSRNFLGGAKSKLKHIPNCPCCNKLSVLSRHPPLSSDFLGGAKSKLRHTCQCCINCQCCLSLAIPLYPIFYETPLLQFLREATAPLVPWIRHWPTHTTMHVMTTTVNRQIKYEDGSEKTRWSSSQTNISFMGAIPHAQGNRRHISGTKQREYEAPAK